MGTNNTMDAFFKNVATKHSSYVENLPIWTKNRVTCKGATAVKCQGTSLLPKLEGQDANDYEAYKTRANFFPAAKKTLAAIVGMIHAKAPVVKFPKAKIAYLEEVGLDDASISEISMLVNFEQALQGRVGILTDYETKDNNEIAPYIAIYTAESIWNWRESKVKGQTRLSMVVLEEKVAKNPGDMFDSSTKSQLRVIWLDPDDGFVRVAELAQLENPSGTGSGYALIGDIRIPSIRGKNLETLPFMIVGAQSIASSVEESPVEPIVDVNLSQYRTSADLEHGRHYTALPTYYLVADTSDDPQLRVGGPSFIHIRAQATEAQIGILEYTGQGLSALEKADEQKKQEMAVLGARMLQTEKKQAEAADTVRLRQASENSVISNIARVGSRALTYSLELIADMLALPSKEVSFELTTDFLTISIDPKMVDSLASLVATERMSLETFYYNLAQGGLYPDGHSFEDELALIDKESARANGDKNRKPMDLGLDPADEDPDVVEEPLDE